MKVLVKQKCSVWINGAEFSFDAGVHEVDEDKARILVTAGYAEYVEKDDEEKKKGSKKQGV